MSWLSKLIGFAGEFQCRVNLLAVEAPVFEELGLPNPLPEALRPIRAEAFLTDSSRERRPIELRLTKPGLHAAPIDTALTELRLDTGGPLSLADARTDEAVQKPPLVEQTIRLQTIENLFDYLRDE